MNILRAAAAAAAFAIVCTPAMAGGFSFKSKGGNWGGTWAYGDGQASGYVKGYGPNEVKNESGSFSQSEKMDNWSRNESGGFNKIDLEGRGKLESTTSAFSGSGVGSGHGFKSGCISCKRR